MLFNEVASSPLFISPCIASEIIPVSSDTTTTSGLPPLPPVPSVTPPAGNPDIAEEGKDFISNLNPDSLKKINALLEPGLLDAKVDEKFQFERLGYFSVDKESTENNPVFNRTVPLKDSWAKIGNKK